MGRDGPVNYRTYKHRPEKGGRERGEGGGGENGTLIPRNGLLSPFLRDIVPRNAGAYITLLRNTLVLQSTRNYASLHRS